VSGYTKEELLGRSHNIVRHPDTPKETFKDLWDTIQDKKIWRNIIKNRSKDGSSRWYQTTIVPIVDEMENILEYICIRSDITELKFALKNAEEYSNALNSSNLIIRFLPGGNIFYVNEAFEKFS
jgi:PAS domain S-box-containing protein